MKLKPKKIELIKSISNAAPKKFKDRVFLIMNDHMPWVAGSAIVFIWFSYPILRFIWGIKKDEITQWKVDIKNIFGKFFLIYFITITCVNLGMVSIFLIIVDESLFSQN
ncbi:membrane protein [Aliivibrio wodanis]|uniref:Membrane protein n=1 Tax=Aliivibrio wodanis TaxID=80852 RepID=A0A090IB01_9GAMM|nr:membrane protein [Aliivibrio wodanis]